MSTPASGRVPSVEARREQARDGLKQIAKGAAFLGLGLAVTIGTYSAARPGGTYTLAWGPALFGLVELVRGLVNWWPNREAVLSGPPVVMGAPRTPAVTGTYRSVARPGAGTPAAGTPGPPAGSGPATTPTGGQPSVRPVGSGVPPPASPPTLTVNDAERRRIGLTTTEARAAERPAAPWHRPAAGVRRETDPITLLRFAAHRCEIKPEGLKASYPDGTTREVPWAELTGIAIRQLPPDPPWERSLLVDVTCTSGAPVRILSTTFVNFAVLPGGATPTRLDNLRRFALLLQEKNPAVVLEAMTEPVVRSGGAPARLLSMNQFAQYDTVHG